MVPGIAGPRYVGGINVFALDFITAISCIRPYIQKAWSLNANPRFLIHRPFKSTRAISKFEKYYLGRKLIVAVLIR